MVQFNTNTLVLIDCIKMQVNEGGNSFSNMFQNRNINWNELLSVATAHKLMPCLGKSLNIMGGSEIPQSFRDEVTQICDAIVEKNKRHIVELKKILNTFKENGLDVIPYKGPALALFYQDPGSRQFYDLDLIMKKHDLEHAIKILYSMGYVAKCPSEVVNLAADIDKNNTIDFYNEKKAIEVDIHWTMTKSYYKLDFDMASLWNRSIQDEQFYEIKARVLCAEDILIATAIHHGLRNCWKKLIYLSDIAQIVKKNPSIDWEKATSIADKAKIKKCLYVGLALAHTLFDLELPADLQKRISGDKAITSICRSVCKLLSGEINNFQRIYYSHSVKLNMREGWLIKSRVFYNELLLLISYYTKRAKK